MLKCPTVNGVKLPLLLNNFLKKIFVSFYKLSTHKEQSQYHLILKTYCQKFCWFTCILEPILSKSCFCPSPCSLNSVKFQLPVRNPIQIKLHSNLKQTLFPVHNPVFCKGSIWPFCFARVSAFQSLYSSDVTELNCGVSVPIFKMF